VKRTAPDKWSLYTWTRLGWALVFADYTSEQAAIDAMKARIDAAGFTVTEKHYDETGDLVP
jgi:hypothetical protein